MGRSGVVCFCFEFCFAVFIEIYRRGVVGRRFFVVVFVVFVVFFGVVGVACLVVLGFV